MSRTLQVLATKSFARWMRKSKVSDDDLIAATLEMAGGLIDADWGGHVIKKNVSHYKGVGRVQGQEQLLQLGLVVDGFTCLGLKRMTVQTSTPLNSRPCKNWQKHYWDSTLLRPR